jgi:hypothetical protein
MGWFSGVGDPNPRPFVYFVITVDTTFGTIYVSGSNSAGDDEPFAYFDTNDWVIDTWYSVRFEYQAGVLLRAKVWERGTTEPDWMASTPTTLDIIYAGYDNVFSIDVNKHSGSPSVTTYFDNMNFDSMPCAGCGENDRFDNFNRVNASGLGYADYGGPWTFSSGAVIPTVDGANAVFTTSTTLQGRSMVWNANEGYEAPWWNGAPRSFSMRMRFSFNFTLPGSGNGYVQLSVRVGSGSSAGIRFSSVQGHYTMQNDNITKNNYISGAWYIGDMTYDADTEEWTFVAYEEGTTPGTVSVHSGNPVTDATLLLDYTNQTASGPARPVYIDYIDFDYEGKCQPSTPGSSIDQGYLCESPADTGDHRHFQLGSAFVSGSSQVFVDGERMSRPSQYTENPTSGQIIFASALTIPQADSVYVCYTANGVYVA